MRYRQNRNDRGQGFYQNLSYRNDDHYVSEHFSAHLSSDEVRGKDVLDFGCGSGDAAFHMSALGRARHVTGIDIGQKNIDIARQRSRSLGLTNIAFRRGDLDCVDIGCGVFDVIWSDTMIEYLRSPLEAIGSRLFRALRPGGILVISFLPSLFVNRWIYHGLVPVLRTVIPPGLRFLLAYALRPVYVAERLLNGVEEDFDPGELLTKVSYMFVPYVRLTTGDEMRAVLTRSGFDVEYIRPRVKSDLLTTPHLVVKATRPGEANRSVQRQSNL